ncbi:acyltransferase family protein [Agrococcus baldri]|uniref:Acyltransferase 3 domain-containing protein n=1 Tax=Agrococcus baldri TaxID=153730 RepID=A0AA87RCX7_9MICO|nr:acyltransferase family protein [Agrococcus baldri]GEK80689.1 hypothetical protein ABA31_20400 [Agrococcus baldri]
MTSTASLTTGAGTRIHGLDSLRAVALGLGIVLHSLMPFHPGAGAWMFSDGQSSPVAQELVNGIHLFRMVLFMALAGYFGRMVLHRRGAGSYLRDRLLRIGLPAVAFWPFAVASTGVVIGIAAALQGWEPPALAPQGEAIDPLLLLSPGHLWFLLVLLQCVVLTLLARAVLLRALGRERGRRIAERIGAALASPAGVLLAAVPYTAGLLLQESIAGGLREPVTVLPTPSSLTAYLGAFLVGWFLHARPGSLQALARQWPWLLGAAAVLLVAASLLQGGSLPPLLHAPVLAVAGWATAYALLAVSVRFLHRESPAMRYLADASYWSYLMHLPIVLALGLALAGLDWPIAVKLLVTWAGTAVLLLVPYDLFVRSTWIGRWLNGRRRPRALRLGRRRVDPLA